MFEANVSKRRRAGVLVLACSVLFLAACDRERGFAAVEELCAKDGGEQIYDTVFVNGYLANGRSVKCRDCASRLSTMDFEFMDVDVEAGETYRDIRGPGHYRFSLSGVGDPRCQTLDGEGGDFFWTERSWGLPEGRCLVIERLNEDASELSWETRRESIALGDGLNVTMLEHVVFNVRTNAVLARHRDYMYTSRWARFWGAIEAGGANPDAVCNGPGVWTDIDGLLQRVLRDRTKAVGALIELSSQELAANGLQLPLAAGMQVWAEIMQGKRTVLGYLLSPVERVADKAGTER